MIMSHLAEEDSLQQSHRVGDQRERAAAARLIKFAGWTRWSRPSLSASSASYAKCGQMEVLKFNSFLRAADQRGTRLT
jgi:hypothetical protein